MSFGAPEAGGADAAKLRLLLVDDKPARLAELEAILASPAHELVAAGSAAHALRELAAGDFAVAIVSAEVAAQIKAAAPHVQVMTVSPLAETGAVDVLHRPLDAKVVRGKVSVLSELFTARSRVEQLTATLGRADQLQQQFLATLGQELRAPLNTILGWIRMLRDGTIRESQRVRALDTIEQTATAQLEMIQEVIDISRMTSGTLTLELGSVDLAKTVHHAIETMRPVALEKLLTFHAAIDDDVLPMSGDHERLRQVVQRLVENAVEGTPTEGLVTVSLRNVGSRVELAITDTGAGIEAQLLPVVFDRFVGDTLNARAGGGLGLALVRHLVELHAGTISAESAGPGLGCSIVVNLPAEGRTPRTDDEVR